MGLDTTDVDAAAFLKVLPDLQITRDAINITNEVEIENDSACDRLYNKTPSGTSLLRGELQVRKGMRCRGHRFCAGATGFSCQPACGRGL